MAKTSKNTRKDKNENEATQSLPDDFLGLLRAVVNGDEEARQQLKTILDMVEGMPPLPQEEKDFNPFGADWEPDLVFKGNLTLKRNDVKEYHLRVKLNHTSRKIWRELLVPSNITLEALAYILIDVMGWTCEHLFGFRHKNQQYSSASEIAQSLFDEDLDFAKFALSDLLVEKGDKMKFDYDYGDSWEHDVWVKGIREYQNGEKPHIKFVKGFGACPPEDCGGVCGYEELLEITQKKRKTADDKERLEWYEMTEEFNFNPDDCDEVGCREAMKVWNNKLQQ